MRRDWTQADLFFRPNWTRQPPFQDDNEGWSGRKSMEEATSFLQNWLYFGLLTAIFGPEIDLQDFVTKNSNGEDIITTVKLYDRVSDLFHSLPGIPPEVLQFQKVTIDRHLHLTHQVYSHICQNTTVNPAVLLSIAILADFLAVIRNVLYWKGIPPEDELVFSWPVGDFTADILTNIMSKGGWCVSQIIRSKRLSPSGQYFVSNLNPPPSEKPHQQCERFKCVAYKMDWDTYKTKHVTGKCECGMVSTTSDSLVRILARARVPLISTTKPFREGDSVTLLEAQGNTRYVAISHVWSDILGNLQANSLPVCQLNHIADLVRKLYPAEDGPVPFWIDTICCPVAPRSARDMAIVLMRKTYLDADKVLVLDNYLRGHSLQGTSKFEPIVRIFCSGWTQRLWTLQEGILARSLHFQFADTAIDFQQSWLDLVRGNEQQPEFHNLLGFYIRLRGDWKREDSPPVRSIQNVVVALHERSTSVPTDEALCLGTLLGVDMESLVQVPPQQRMKRFWSLQSSYTGELTFWTGRRLKDDGYRWAPASFLDARLESLPGNSFTNASSPAHCSDDGLHVTYPGVILGTITEHLMAQCSWLRSPDKEWKYWVSCTTRRDGNTNNDLFENYSIHKGYQVALILRSPIEDLGHGLPGETKLQATVVVIKKQLYDIIHVEIFNTATIYLGRPGIIPAHQLEVALLQMEILTRQENESSQKEDGIDGAFIWEDRQHFLDGQTWLPSTQEWCLA